MTLLLSLLLLYVGGCVHAAASVYFEHKYGEPAEPEEGLLIFMCVAAWPLMMYWLAEELDKDRNDKPKS